MGIENKEQLKELKKFGNIEVEKAADGKILRINDIVLQQKDKILIVQRHQKPGTFTKEQLLKSAPRGVEDLSNLDYTHDPKTTRKGKKLEKELLAKSQEVFGNMDFTATTVRKRGSEHKKLLKKQFPDSKKDSSIDHLLDDSGLGLIGESFYGAHKYSLEESKKLFKQDLTKEAKFGRGPYKKDRKPLSYAETWIKLGYLSPSSRWKVESPEELAERTKVLLDKVDEEKNYFITHEANCIVFHILAKKDAQELQNIVNQLDVPDGTKSDIKNNIDKAENILDVFQAVKKSLTEKPIKGYHYKKTLTSFLESMELKSGDKNKGYGAISVYILREDEKGKKALLEASYDQQA